MKIWSMVGGQAGQEVVEGSDGIERRECVYVSVLLMFYFCLCHQMLSDVVRDLTDPKPSPKMHSSLLHCVWLFMQAAKADGFSIDFCSSAGPIHADSVHAT